MHLHCRRYLARIHHVLCHYLTRSIVTRKVHFEIAFRVNCSRVSCDASEDAHKFGSKLNKMIAIQIEAQAKPISDDEEAEKSRNKECSLAWQESCGMPLHHWMQSTQFGNCSIGSLEHLLNIFEFLEFGAVERSTIEVCALFAFAVANSIASTHTQLLRHRHSFSLSCAWTMSISEISVHSIT